MRVELLRGWCVLRYRLHPSKCRVGFLHGVLKRRDRRSKWHLRRAEWCYHSHLPGSEPNDVRGFSIRRTKLRFVRQRLLDGPGPGGREPSV